MTGKTPQELFERALGLHRAGRAREAEPLYRKVIAQRPQHPQALFGLGVILLETGRNDEAARSLERAVKARPDEPRYLTNLGEAYRRLGKLEPARQALERAIALNPDFAEARQNLAVTYIQLGAHDDARRELERVVALQPDAPVPRVSLSWVLLRLEQPARAAEEARRAVELAPNLASAHRHLASALDALGDKPAAIASYRECLALEPSEHEAHSDLLLCLLTDPGQGPREHFEEARAWARRHAAPLRSAERPHPNPREPERRLRVGYVSADFRAHAAQQFLVPLLTHHDAERFEIFLYSSVERPDAETDWYRSFAGERFRDIRALGDTQAAELIRRDGIDLLVDLTLHGPGRRLLLFARKPAPVQLTWLGYAGTTGLVAVDYRITDPYFDPPGSDLSLYSETSLHLPQSFWCYASLVSDLPVGPLPALARGFVTFGCLNNPRKLHPGVLALWARVLRELPGSRLLLHLEAWRQDAARAALEREGIGRERIEFWRRAPRRDYLAAYGQFDIALDTFPFAGGTTSIDASFMGVPVVTLRGEPTLQRAGVSVAMNLGLPELVAESPDEFVEKALGLARDLERLARLRAELRARLESSALGDAPGFARALEALYRTAWRRYCDAR